MISTQAPLILGSGSPRRREILTALGVPHRVVPGNAEEATRAGERPEPYLERIVQAKLESVRLVLREQGGAAPPGGHVLVADTIVVLDEEILGKPTDREHAFELVSRLAGRTHQVLTRFCVGTAFQPPTQPAAALLSRTVGSLVTLRAAAAQELRRYADSGEGLDKAGGYAAQGLGAFLVRAIEGSFSNVVGLPACEVVEALVSLGLLAAFP